MVPFTFLSGYFYKYKNRLGGNIGYFEMEFWQTWQLDAREIELIEFYGKVR